MTIKSSAKLTKMRRKTIQYAIDIDTGLIVSRINDQLLIPILEYEMGNFKDPEIFNLEFHPIHVSIYMHLFWTKKIPLEDKNKHREKWGMKLLKKQKNDNKNKNPDKNI